MSKGWSQRRACALVGLARGSYHPVVQARTDEPVQAALLALSERHPGCGGFENCTTNCARMGWSCGC